LEYRLNSKRWNCFTIAHQPCGSGKLDDYGVRGPSCAFPRRVFTELVNLNVRYFRDESP
jgi:hypothetical protein